MFPEYAVILIRLLEVGILSLIFAGSCLHVSIYTCLFGKLCCILRKNTCRTTAFEAGSS